jgi:hypothetical protein
MLKTIAEIKEYYQEGWLDEWERIFSNIRCESGEYLDTFDDDDEFYTDDYRYIKKEEAKDYLKYEWCVQYIDECGLYNDFKFYCLDDIFKDAIFHERTIKKSYIKKCLFDFCKEDLGEYMDWWLQENRWWFPDEKVIPDVE